MDQLFDAEVCCRVKQYKKIKGKVLLDWYQKFVGHRMYTKACLSPFKYRVKTKTLLKRHDHALLMQPYTKLVEEGLNAHCSFRKYCDHFRIFSNSETTTYSPSCFNGNINKNISEQHQKYYLGIVAPYIVHNNIY